MYLTPEGGEIWLKMVRVQERLLSRLYLNVIVTIARTLPHKSVIERTALNKTRTFERFVLLAVHVEAVDFQSTNCDLRKLEFDIDRWRGGVVVGA